VIGLRRLWRRLVSLVGRTRLDRDLDDELGAHLECAVADYIARGASPEEAKHAALRDFGGVITTKETYRDVRGFPVLEALAQDIRFSLRVLCKSPIFTTVAVVTLALGIGANGAIFGVADSLLARPLPGIDTKGLAVVAVGQKAPAAAADYFDWKTQTTTFVNLAAYRQRDVNFTGIGPAERIYGAEVSPNFFATLGVGASLGRTLAAQTEGIDETAVVLAHGYWQRRFGGDASVVGRTIALDGHPYTIVGVTPPDVEMPMPTDVWLPLNLTAQDRARRDVVTLRVFGRLKPEATLERAQAEFAAIGRQLESGFPATNRNRRPHVMPLDEFVQGTMTRAALFLLLGSVGIVLAIACLNIAGLQVARVTSRARERALRAALGASRWRIVQLVVVENLVVAAMGGIAGILVASGCLTLLLRSMPAEIVRLIPGFARIHVDGRGVAFMAAATLLSGIVSGILPAIGSARRRLVASGPRQRTRSVFVVSQIAVAIVMLLIGWMFVQGHRELLAVHQVADASHVVVMNVNLPASRYETASSRARFFDTAVNGLTATPGTVTAATCTTVPLSNNGTTWVRADVDGYSPPAAGGAPVVVQQIVSPQFFELMGIALRDGRMFTTADRLDTTPVVIVSEKLARMYWPERGAIGRRIRLRGQDDDTWREVVGVAGNVLYDWTTRSPEAVVYAPVAQLPLAKSALTVRVAGDPSAATAALTAALARIDPLLPAFDVKSLESAIAGSFAGTTQISFMMNMLAALSFAIALIGIYGIIAYTVAARTREFGVRMALGARRMDIFRLVMRHAVVLAIAGVGFGLLGVMAAAPITRSLVTNAAPGTQALTLIAIAGLVAMAALLACCGPARVATKADPVASLRAD
jgi:predicted permease